MDYIVKHTVGKQVEGRSPAQLAGQNPTRDNPSRDSNGASTQAGILNHPSETPGTPVVRPFRSVSFARGRDGGAPFRVLDMACGSGSFLLGAYQCLLDHCLKWYSDHQPGSHGERLSRRGSFPVYKDPRTGAWRLTIEEKKRILTTHIFGVDIDPQAVEVSKLSLLLKVLEGETDQSLILSQLPFGDRALPNLADNIKCGNSLIGPAHRAAPLGGQPSRHPRRQSEPRQ